MFLELTGFPLILVSLVAFFVIIGLIVCLHEAGHFVVAKKSGVLCHEFSIGMGPALYKKKYGETNFCVRSIPLGGYVQMAGEQATDFLTKIGTKVGLNLNDDIVTEIILDENASAMVRGEITDKDLDGKDGKDLYITILDDMGQTHYYQVKEDAMYVFEKGEELQITPYKRVFDAKPCWKRFLILFAGPVMNFVLALFLYLIIAFATGVPNYNSTKIGTVLTNYPAYNVLEVGDSITAINGVSIDTWTDFSSEMSKLKKNYDTEVTINYIDKDNNQKSVTLDAYVALVSIGLTNYEATNYKLTTIPGTDVKGLEVGNVGIRYKNDKYKGGITKGDYITKMSINGKEYELLSWGQLMKIYNELEVTTSLDVRFEYYHKEDNTYKLVTLDECESIEPYTDELLTSQNVAKIAYYIGISPETHFSFFGCIKNAFKQFWSDFTLIFRTLKILIHPSSVRQVGVSDLSSVVGIFDLVKKYIGAGFLALLSLTAMLSVNIGVMNLLPIPALDGGRICFVAYEAITRKKPSKKVENVITLVFMLLLLLLFVFVTYNDILRLVK